MRRIVLSLWVVLGLLLPAAVAAQEPAPGVPNGPTPNDVLKSPNSLAGTNVAWVVRFKALLREFAPGQTGDGDRAVFEWRDASGAWTDRVIIGPPLRQIRLSDATGGQLDRSLDAEPRVITGTVRGAETVIDASGRSQAVVVLGSVALDRLSAAAPTGAGVADANGVYQPGGKVTWPAVVREVKPKYPPRARDARIECAVELELVLAEDGRVAEARVTKVSIEPDTYGFAQAALDAAKQWRFKPGFKDGKPVPTRVGLVLEFRLHEP